MYLYLFLKKSQLSKKNLYYFYFWKEIYNKF